MNRRKFIAGLTGATLWSPAGMAQVATTRYRIGMLDTSPRPVNINFGKLQQELAQRGLVEGQNLTIAYRSADGGNDMFAALARELVALNVDVIVTRGTPAALAAKAATTTIPVVMAAAGDPLGIARNRDRPALNMTGFGASISGAEGKRIEALKQMLPRLERVAALMNLSNPSRRAEWGEIETAARSMGIAAQVLDIRALADIERAFETATRSHADAIVVGSDTLMQTNQSLVVNLAAAHRLPAMYTFRDFVDNGGLVSYGVSLPDLYRRAGGYVDRILKGAKPADLPIEQPTKFDLVINAKAANAIGLTIPGAFLARADEIVE
ncbi:MAG TPA: ABC transporter substrate-binding protein [Xanthobacteraceae bacterium]|nr:ABC transporter substrate-binding protein [Xanthobacteraceae bacterium]